MSTRLAHSLRHEVANCEGIYTAYDVARHFSIAPSTVQAIWADPPSCVGCPGYSVVADILDTTVTHDLIVADAQILADRGYSLTEVAIHFGVSPSTVTRALSQAGRTLRLHDWYTDVAVRNFDGSLKPAHEVAP